MTKVFYQPRGNGKTKRLIEMSNKFNQIIITCNAVEIRAIKKRADDMGLNIPEPRTAIDYIRDFNNFNQFEVDPVLVDEATHVLRSLLGAKITAITVSDESETIECNGIDEIKKRNEMLTREVELLRQLLEIKEKQIKSYKRSGEPRFKNGGVLSEPFIKPSLTNKPNRPVKPKNKPKNQPGGIEINISYYNQAD